MEGIMGTEVADSTEGERRKKGRREGETEGRREEGREERREEGRITHPSMRPQL